MIKVNQGLKGEGMAIFKQNLSMLNTVPFKEMSDEMKKVLKHCELFAFMFTDNTKYSELYYLIKKVLEDESLSNDIVLDTYAKAYLFIDNDLNSKAIDTLQGISIKSVSKTRVSENTLSNIRYYSAYTEAILDGFQNRNINDLDKAFTFLQYSKKENNELKNIFFNFLNEIMEGYITNNKSLIKKGLLGLKRNQYSHYFDWYRKKISKY